ncbi:MAG TPA: hypothetical protein VK447_20980 [Myxococcaceae bacterium]|nr:hypothetical protein [Myxococcaceae bacterium]
MTQHAEPATAGDIFLRIVAYFARAYLLLLAVGAYTELNGQPDIRFLPYGMILTAVAVAVAWFLLKERRRLHLLAASMVAGGAGAVVAGGGAGDFFGIMLLVWPLAVGLPLVLALHGLQGVRPWKLGRARPEERTAYGPPVLPLSSPALAPALEDPGVAADEARIHQRLREIDAQQARIDGVQAMLERELGPAALQPVREKLDYAEGVLQSQRARHEARLWSIDLVRWQQALAIFVEHTAESTQADAERRLAELASVVQSGKALLARWERDQRIGTTPEGERCIAHMRDLLARCEEVRQGIVVQQAMLAIRGIAPGEDEMRSTALSTEPLESLQTELGPGGSLAASLAGFEAEHERLREDHAAAQDVERFLTQLERGQA